MTTNNQPISAAAVIEKCKQGQEITWEEYCVGTNRTLSDKFYGSQMPIDIALTTLNQAIEVGQKVDKLKKALMYGKDVEETYDDLRVWVDYRGIRCKGVTNHWPEEVDPKIIHAILGIFTEAVELVESLYDSLAFAKSVNTVNLGEELGDLLWYMAIFFNTGTLDSFNVIMRKNLLKLFIRYGEKFTQEAAINRDLDAELKVLSAGETSPLA